MEGGPSAFPQGFSCLVVLWIPPADYCFPIRDFHSLWRDFPDPSAIDHTAMLQSIPRSARTPVWALPLSLAATNRIDVSFSSSPYLDVSVQEVPDLYLCIQYRTTEVCSARFPHSEICGSLNICFLPQLITSLIGSQCQGIHPALFLT